MTKRMRRRNEYGVFAIAAAYVGTVVGAGFASGQEILLFFTAYGRMGLVGLGIATLLFAYIGARFLTLAFHMKAASHHPLIHFATGPVVGVGIDWILTVFLLLTTAAMAAGAGSTLLEQYGLARPLGSALMVGFTVFTVITGIKGVVRAIAFVAPVLVTAVLALSLQVLWQPEGVAAVWRWLGDTTATPIPFWFVASPLYVAYNLILAIPILAPLGGVSGNKKTVLRGGLLGGIGLGIGAAAIHLALATGMPDVARADIPILQVVARLPAWVPVAYSLLLLLEIYSTAIATLFGFSARVEDTFAGSFNKVAIGGGIVSWMLGQLSFATLVGTLYPIMGIIGAVVIVGVLSKRWTAPTVA